MAKYKKRKDGRYCANIQTGYDEITGKKKYQTVYAHSIAELERKRATVIVNISQGTYINDERLTFGEWADQWLLTYKSTKSGKTIEMYKNILKNHIADIAEMRLKDIKQVHIQNVINSKIDTMRIAEQTRLTIYQILETAIDNDYVHKNACRNIELPERIKSEKRVLTDLEKELITKAHFTLKQKCFIYILYHAGLRRGEILALCKSDIDFDKKTLSINKAITFISNKSILKEPKTQAGIRQIPLTDVLIAILRSYMDSIDTEYLFTMNNNQMMSKSSYRRFWNSIIHKMKAAASHDVEELYSLTAHIFRHNYATSLYYASVSIKDAQHLLGHADVQTTLNIYTHLDNKNIDIAKKLNSYFN